MGVFSEGRFSAGQVAVLENWLTGRWYPVRLTGESRSSRFGLELEVQIDGEDEAFFVPEAALVEQADEKLKQGQPGDSLG